MAEHERESGPMELPAGHPAKGAPRSSDVGVGEQGDLKDLSRAMEGPGEEGGDAGEGTMKFDVSLDAGTLSIHLDGRLASAFRVIGEDPVAMVRTALMRTPDLDLFASSLSGRTFYGLLLDESIHPFEDHRRNGFFGLNRAVFQAGDPVLRRILLQVGIVHQIRHEALPEGRDHEAIEPSLMKKDAGLFLLLLTDYKRKVFFLPRILKEVDALIDPGSGFRDVLAPILTRLPFVQREDPADSPYGIVFLNQNAFDRLAFREKLKVVLGGVLAWYTVLSIGVLAPFASLFRRLTPYFPAALQILRHSFKEGFLLKRGFLGRAVRALFRGNLPEAVEFFWSGWNPVLVRVAVRPVFRLLGGNRAPVLATAGTFFYTAWIVHLLWFAFAILLGFRVLGEAERGFALGRTVGSNANFAVLFGAVGAYTLFGLLSGLSKRLRAHRTRALRKS
jgi:hypothetical protein